MKFVGESIVVLFLDKLIEVLKERAKLLIGVKHEVKLLLDNLGMIIAFLQDSEAEREEHVAATKLEVIKQMREVAFEVEHVIDKYTYHVVMQKRRNMLGKSAHHLFDLGGIGNTIIDIKNRIDGIHNNKGRYEHTGVQQAAPWPAAGGSRPLFGLNRSNSIIIERDDAVGFAGHTDTWIRRLTNGQNLKPDVLMIMGMGGLGKSKLSRKIYNAIVAQGGYFECWSWVYGCREFECRNWLVDILKCMQPLEAKAEAATATANIDGITELDELKEKVRRRLQGKRYLVVLDGMWDTGEWENIGTIFPDDRNGSKIVITCREGVITSAPDQCCWFLPLLDNDDSWRLLCSKVFEGSECPENLKDTGMELAANCKGLPLSVMVLGKELSKVRLVGAHHSLETWRSYERHVNSHLIRTKTLCFDVLAESYIHLPPELKFCFLYLSLFPEDFVISARQLTELWSAEGLIRDNVHSRDVVDVAEDYLTKLVNRSLIQVVSKRIHGANVKTCRVHSILRELSRFEGEREKFVELRSSDGGERAPTSSAGRARRLSIQGNIFAHISSPLYDSSSASSLLLFSESRATFEQTHWKRIFKCFKYVRVLYLWKVSIKSIPSEIENLIFLSSITIWGDKKLLEIESIPDSICNLEHLETINIDGHVKQCLPKRIWKLMKLRHLRVSKGMWLPPPKSTSRHIHVMNLRILSGVIVDENTASLMSHSMFRKLKKLHLVYVPKKQNKQVDEAKLRVDKARQGLNKATKKINKAKEKLNEAEKKVMEAEKKVKEAEGKQEEQQFELRKQVWKSLENLPNLESLKFIDFEKFVATQYKSPSTVLHKMTFVNSYMDLEYLTMILHNFPTLGILKIKRPYGPNVDQLNGAHGMFPRLQTFQLV